MAKKHYDTTPINRKDPQPDLEPCVKYVRNCWEKWDSHWSGKIQEFTRFYDRWIGKPPKRDEDWQANFHKKLTWQAEKTLVSRYHSALFPVTAPIDTDTVEVRDEFQAIIAKSTVAHWFKVGLVSKEFLSGMRSAAIYGTGMFEDDWYVRTERLPEYVEKDVPDYRAMTNDQTGEFLLDEGGNVRTQQIGTKKQRMEEWNYKVVEDRYRLRKSNIFAWRIHPDKLDDDDDCPVIKQEFVNFDTLLERQREAQKKGFKAFDNMDKIEADKTKISEEDKARLMKDGTFYDESNPNLEILYYWGLYEDKDEKEPVKKPMWIAIVNRKFRLFKWDNPRWDKKPPLLRIVWTEDEKASYYGIGLAQIGADSEDRANTNVNTRTDIKKKIIKSTGWYDATDKKIKKKHLTNTTPGFMRPCSDVNKAFKYDTPPTLTPDDYKEEEVSVNDHREITGATNSLLPPADKSQQPDTLGGMRLNLSQSLARLKPDLTMMELQGIRKIANRAFMLTRQNLKEPMWIELMASEDKLKQLQIQKIYQLDPRLIIGKVNFHCTGLSESIEKSQNIDKLIKVMEISAKIPPVQAITNYQAMMKQIYLWLGIEEAEKFIQMNPNLPLQSIPQIPQGVPQGIPRPGGNGGLPPEILQRIVLGLRGGQGALPQQGQPPPIG